MMKHLKKVLALVVVFAMSLSVVAFAGTTYADVADDATYAEAVKVLKELEVMIGDDQGNFNPDKIVTRAEMATILCNITGTGELAPVNSGFADATSAHWASGYIAYAKNAGWINGYDANTFGPDDTVKWEQAVKLLMAALNYGIYAEENGGYPTGWIMAAAEAGVTDTGAQGGVGEDCTRAKIAMLVYYALDADMMKQTSYGDKKWEIIEGETLLSKYLDTYKVEGKITNSYKLTDDLDDGYVDFTITKTNGIDVETELDAVAQYVNGDLTGYALSEIDAAGTDAADLLAYSTVAYIHKNDDDELSIVAIAAKGKRNKVYEITDMDLVYNDGTLSYNDFDDSGENANRKTDFETADKYKFAYWNDRDEDNVISYVKVDPNVLIVLNSDEPKDLADFGATTADILAAIVPASGSITMVDTDSDGYIDLYTAYSYGVAVVDSVNVSKQKINFKEKTASINKGSISFDTDDNTNLKTVTMTLDGKEISIEDLAENDVLTISTNDYDDPRYYDIIVTRDVIEGKISNLGSVSSATVGIDGVDYKFVGNGLIEYNDVAVNDEGTFYLAANGKIAYFDDTTVASTNYAIVDKFVKDSMDTVSMKVLTLEGTSLTADVAEKIKLNGVKVTLTDAPAATALEKMGLDITGTYATYYDLIKAIVDGTEDILGAGNVRLNKLITYDVSGDAIDEIDFAIVSTDTKEFGYVGTKADVEWQADNSRFQSSKTLSENTVVFNLGDTSATIDDWKITNAAGLVDENIYTPYFFANQKDGTVGVVVIFDSTSTINQDNSLAFFVSYKTGVYGEDEEDVMFVDYYVDGALATEALPVYDTDYDDTLVTGDAFLYAIDDKGIVDTIVKVFSAEAGTFATLGSGDLDDFMMYDADAKLDNEVYFGVLVKTAGGKLTVAAVPADGDTEILFDSFNTITVADTAKVLQYKSYATTDAKKIVACDSVLDLEASEYTRVSGTQDVNLTDAELTYVFFRMNNGTVTEVMGIDYTR